MPLLTKPDLPTIPRVALDKRARKSTGQSFDYQPRVTPVVNVESRDKRLYTIMANGQRVRVKGE